MLLKILQVNLIVLFLVQLHFNCNGADWGPFSLACAVCTLTPFSAPPKHLHIFTLAPLLPRVGVNTWQFITSPPSPPPPSSSQPSNGPIRAKHITQCSSVIGQYNSWPLRITEHRAWHNPRNINW